MGEHRGQRDDDERKQGHRQELSEDEAHRVLTAAKTSVSRSLYPAILISMHTGLRNKELRLMRWHQVEGTITVGKSKTEGGEGRLVPLSKTAWRVMKERRSEFPDALPEHVVFPRESCGLMGTKGTFGGKVAPTRRSQTSPSDPGILP